MKALPSIGQRVSRAALAWSVVWSVAVSLAVGLALQHELDEQFDDQLQATAQVMAVLLEHVDPQKAASVASALPTLAQHVGAVDVDLAWQVVAADQVILRSAQAPQAPLLPSPRSGFVDAADWRVLGTALGESGRMLYVAQSRTTRTEELAEVMLSTTLAALAVVLLAYVWMAARLRRELLPLQVLSDEVAAHDPLDDTSRLGPAQRQELESVHEAIEALGLRLRQRLRREQAFSAHAAHALRTPLAGIDAQLSVALREAPAALQPRLQRVREAADRLQRVVLALLALFRTDAPPHLEEVDLKQLAQRLLVAGLDVTVKSPALVQADADLLAAALLNLLDNAQRHGALHVVISLPQPGCVRVHDDGPGMDLAQRIELQQALQVQDYARLPGLGLVLADAVARVHGGRLAFAQVDHGFAVELQLTSETTADGLLRSSQ
jgi:signal transduction histidine kinase